MTEARGTDPHPLSRVAVLATVLTLSPCALRAGEIEQSRWPGLNLSVSIGAGRQSDFEPAAGRSAVSPEDFRATINLGTFKTDSLVLRPALDYQYTRFEFRDVASRNRDLHRVQLPLRATRVGESWHTDAFIAVGISASSNVVKDVFNRGSSADLLFTARTEFTRRDGRLPLIVGAAYDRSFGRPRLSPVFGVELQPRRDLQLRLAYPDSELRYEVSTSSTLLARIYPAGHRWRVTTDDFADEFDYRAEEVRFELTWSLAIAGPLTIDLTAGYAFDRRHAFDDRQGSRIDTNIDEQPFAGIGFRLGAAPLPYANGARF